MSLYLKQIRLYSTSLSLAILLGLSANVFANDEDRESMEAQEAVIESIAQDPDLIIQSIVMSWGVVIEGMGGSVSQLEATLRTKDAETLLQASEAASIEEINSILSGN